MAKKDVIRDKNITEQLIVDKYATNIQIVINNLKLVPILPNIIDVNNQTIKEGNNAVFKSNANINDFIKVSIDGNDIDITNYTVISGSTIITLNKNYLSTLCAGNHNISIVSKNGIVTTNFTIKK
ncbi:MAG: hypothetical protein RR646_05850 [Erysipelotrichaceae bacterium]